MKKSVSIGIILILTFAFAAHGQCWPWDKKSVEQPKPAATVKPAAAPAAPKAVEPAVAVPAPEPVLPKVESEKTRSLKEKKRKDVNGTMWEVEVVPMSGKGSKQIDVLYFQNNKFSSDEFLKRGFAPSNFTLSLQDDTVAVVETMQSSEKEGIVFWRVEFDANTATCKGVLSRQLASNKTEDHSFVSVAKRPISQAPAVTAPAKAKSEEMQDPANAPSKQKPGKK